MLAAILGCLDPVATAVAALSSKSPFSVAAGRAGADAADAARRPLRQPQSDFLTVVAAFEAMEAFGRNNSTSHSSNTGQGSANTSRASTGLQWKGDQDNSQDGGRRPGSMTTSSAAREKMFCEKHFLSYSAMVEIRDLRRDFGNLLASAGLVGGSGENSATGKHMRGHNHIGNSDGDSSSSLHDTGDADTKQEGPGTGAAAKRAQRTTAVAASSSNPLLDDTILVGGSSANKHRSNRNLVAAVLAAGLYPHLAVSRTSSSSGAPLEWRCGRRGDGVAPAPSGGAGAGSSEAYSGSSGGGGGGGGSWSVQQGECQIEGERVEVHRDSVNYGAKTLTTK